MLGIAYPVGASSKHETGIPPYCPTALLPDYLAASRVPGTGDPIPSTEDRARPLENAPIGLAWLRGIAHTLRPTGIPGSEARTAESPVESS